MRRTGLQNAKIQQVIAALGHTQKIVICDVGLPIPAGVETIDLAVENGIPGFLDVLRPVVRELVCEKYIYAEEMDAARVTLRKTPASGSLGPQSQPNMQWALRRWGKPWVASEVPSALTCR